MLCVLFVCCLCVVCVLFVCCLCVVCVFHRLWLCGSCSGGAELLVDGKKEHNVELPVKPDGSKCMFTEKKKELGNKNSEGCEEQHQF